MNESMEMYLETIYLLERDHGHAHGADIAKRLEVSKPSVTKATNYLKNQGYVSKEVYGTISLTSLGLKYAENIYRKHTLISAFLEDSLGLTNTEASDNACRMEHIISDQMLLKIQTYLEEKQLS